MMGNIETKLAIVINCYNYENYVGSAIESVLAQKVDACEVVVVDDGSTDSSWEVIRSYPVKAYRKLNGGQVSACLFGFRRTCAPFVMFLDADDELVPNAISRILSLLDNGVSKLQFPLIRIDEMGSTIGAPFPDLPEFRGRKNTINNIVSTGSYLSPPTSGNVFCRDLCTLLADADYDNAADGILLLAAPFFGDIISIKEPLGRYRIHGKNKSRAFKFSRIDALTYHQKRFLARINHFNSLCLKNGVEFYIQDPTKLYVNLRYENYCLILKRKRISLSKIVLTATRLPSWYGIPKRLMVICFLLSCLFMNKNILAWLLDIRLSGKWANIVNSCKTCKGFIR